MYHVIIHEQSNFGSFIKRCFFDHLLDTHNVCFCTEVSNASFGWRYISVTGCYEGSNCSHIYQCWQLCIFMLFWFLSYISSSPFFFQQRFNLCYRSVIFFICIFLSLQAFSVKDDPCIYIKFMKSIQSFVFLCFHFFMHLSFSYSFISNLLLACATWFQCLFCYVA